MPRFSDGFFVLGRSVCFFFLGGGGGFAKFFFFFWGGGGGVGFVLPKKMCVQFVERGLTTTILIIMIAFWGASNDEMCIYWVCPPSQDAGEH